MDETGLYMDRVGTPLGDMIMTSHGEALLGLWFQGERYEPGEQELAGARRNPDLPVFQETRRWLELYFQGKDPGFTPPLELSGSVFRQQVGRIMLTIPYGKTMTYGAIAREMAGKTGKKQMSAQAVGGAVGHNPISLIIPCHRVVGASGSLTGYGGGMPRKVWLLEHEGIDLKASGFTIPKKGTAL